MADWSGLPEDIIDLFSELGFPYAEEFARFSSVSKSFSSVRRGRYRKHRSPFGPLLLLPKSISEDEDGNNNNNNSAAEESERSTSIRGFFSISSQQLFHIELPHSRRQGFRCWGSPYGWLVTLGGDCDIHIFNPLTRAQLSLPPHHTFDFKYASSDTSTNASQNDNDNDYDDDDDNDSDYDDDDDDDECRKLVVSVFKLVLAPNPSFWTTERRSDQCCMAIYGEMKKLAFAFPGDQAWISLESQPIRTHNDSLESPPIRTHNDVIFFHGHFYAVTNWGILRRCDIDTTHPKVTDITSSPKCDRPSNNYLVEMSGDLYMVQSFWDVKFKEGSLADSYRVTKSFEVFKFDLNDRVWTQVSHLGDHALFVGLNSSFSILAYNYPEFKANCIYFTQDDTVTYYDDHWDMGVYHYLDKTIEPFYCGEDVVSKLTRPTFFLPNL